MTTTQTRKVEMTEPELRSYFEQQGMTSNSTELVLDIAMDKVERQLSDPWVRVAHGIRLLADDDAQAFVIELTEEVDD